MRLSGKYELGECYTEAYVRFWTTTLFNFENKQDYYHVVMEQEFDASQNGLYKGQIYSKKYDLEFREKFAGFTYAGPDVYVRWCDTKHPLKDEWNQQPQNEGNISTSEQVSGWSLNADIGYVLFR